MFRRIIISFFLLSVLCVQAQDFNYVHYSTQDGLAGSTVYNMCQDINGFMWFGTENGLSRFDGTGFKNFTVKDGLPDNEVLNLFADSKGRVWIATFNKQICYYYEGKIYNKTNDSILLKLQLKGFAGAIAEDKEGTLAFSDGTNTIMLLECKGEQRVVSALHFKSVASASPFQSCDGKVLLVTDKENIYLYRAKKLEFFCTYEDLNGKPEAPESSVTSFISCDGKIKKRILHKKNYLHSTGVNRNNVNYLMYYSTYDGAWSVDTVNNRWDIHYLKGKKVTKTIIDEEKNLWFSTLGEGVYKLPSHDVKTTKFSAVGTINNNEIFSLSKYNNSIIAGLNHGYAAFLSGGKYELKDLSGHPPKIMRPQSNRLNAVTVVADGLAVFGFDQFILATSRNKKIYNYIYPIKSVDKISNDSILVGTSSFVCIVRPADLKIIDTIWRERCTKVFYHNDKYYIGSLHGLYEVKKDKSYKFLGSIHNSLTRRIADIKAAQDGSLWIATADMGVVAINNGKLIKVINDTVGLSSNICKTLFVQNNFLWVGTNKGLNKINIADKAYTVTTYTASDGLPSDIINAVYAEDGNVYVASPEGLTVFEEKKISSFSVCKLKMMSIIITGQPFDSSINKTPAYYKGSIVFNYIAVSLKSAGDINYYYRLNGLNESWTQTVQSSLNYPSLPPGNYQLQLYAVNKFGVKSETFSFAFTVKMPFWKTWWFYALLILFATSLSGWLVNFRNRKINLKLAIENRRQKQFAELEQQALQAQMNPHFIFNCLNGIQQYIVTGNTEKANEYLTGFARLIRQTLDNSAKKTVTIAQEVNYLTEYLEMEKMRAADAFSYTITVDENVDAANIEIPAMLLQPYIENALRHGLRYKTEGIGMVTIHFTMQQHAVLCTIKDNGVGRKYAAEMKSRQHIEYQSKGMDLTERRINLLNKINDSRMSVTVNDLMGSNNESFGTEVVVKFPLN